ncbi:unnamed protein product [Rotaria sp. Silwood1]|nr:unnamed protein product [Rotaria sp. Silwood1]CAF1237673.1 unnamed protein product [Rotaria sp. Silwood1]CAF3518936.1 unnamed protein product [Rotaria sp. Silwood1]CAF4494390.1 unnamed protein product [Rotaria sp. Silwood1]CAF4599583.1 unnamed protein product [Rotaria sp. Silwood1]
MIQASRTEEPDSEFQITSNVLSASPSTSPLTSRPWLKRARIITALIYILLQTAYFIFIVICIALYPRCEKAPATSWWTNGVFLRLSTRTMKFNNLTEKISDYKKDFDLQALWLSPIFPLSNELNPLEWKRVDSSLGNVSDLTGLIGKAHENGIQILVDYPLNHLSIQSNYFTSNDDSYFVWNDQGSTNNWKTINDNQQSAWTYNDRKNSFYLHQFNNDNDSIDINYRNNRVFNDMIDSFSFWDKNFHIDGFNLQGISFAYEDYEYKNETNDNSSRLRHLDEDYLLLARIRAEIDKDKILLLDKIDSLATSNEQLLTRYYGDKNKYLGGVQLASLNNYILVNENKTNLTLLFKEYYNSIFFKNKQPFLWSSLSSNSTLNEAFFAACLFHNGSIAIDIERQDNQFSENQRTRLREIIQLTQIDVFRVGHVRQTILPKSNWLTIELTRRGEKNHMIIINFNHYDEKDKIELKEGKTDAVEVILTNKENPDSKYEKNTLLSMTQDIELKSYEYLIIRWSRSIEGLGIIF